MAEASNDVPLDQRPWHGVPRHDIPWYPTVDHDTCIGCTLCFVTCGRGVYGMADDKASVENAYNCMVGCSTCATVCPVQAIRFPDRELVWKVEREHKVFRVVRREAEAKQATGTLQETRARAVQVASSSPARVRFEVAGEFGDKRFLLQLEELVRDEPVDLVDLRLEVPTVKGLLERTPAYMAFEVASLTPEAQLSDVLERMRSAVHQNGLVLVSETPL